MTRTMTVVLFSTLMASWPAVSTAQQPSTHVEKAQKLYAEAMAEHDEGNYRKAASLLAKAHSYDPNLAYQYNRIRMLQANGDYADALEVARLYEDAMNDDPEGRFPSITKLRKKLEEQAGVATPEAATSDADPPGPPPVEAAAVEAEPVAPPTTDPPPAPADDAPTKPLAATSNAAAEPQAQQRASRGGTPTRLVFEIGAGVTLLGGVLAVCAYDIITCDSPDTMSASELEARQNRQAILQPASLVVIAGGLVTMGVGLYFIQARDAEKEANAWHITPVFGPDGAGAMVRGRF